MKKLELLPQARCGDGSDAAGGDLRPSAERFKALGDPTRLAIVRQLAGADEVCVCHLAPGAGLSQPTISHHLKLLRDAGLVTSERRGTWAYYRLVPEAIAELAGLLDLSAVR
jgi:ArsR family transcriptional regulator